MSRYSLVLILLKIFLVVHAQSHPLNLGSEPAGPELLDIIDDDDILYGSTPPNGYGYETFPGPQPTRMTYGGLLDDPFLTHTGSQSQTITSATNASTTSTSTTKQSQLPHTYSPTSVMPTTTSSSVESTATAFTSPNSTSDSSGAMPRSDAKQWKIIGLVVICITFIGVATLTIVFFDAWWGFLRAVVCRRRYGQEREDMVPDWEKRSWEYKIPIPGNDGYPTTASMENLTANAAGIGAGAGRARGGIGQAQELLPNPHSLPTGRFMSPQPMYAPEFDRHPLEPLVRRPSTNPRSPYT